MKTEYEVRILEIDTKEVIQKLQKMGATKIQDSVQKRYVYDFNPAQKGKWIRLRSNGKKSTLTIKEIVNSNIDGTKELEVEVSDFEETNMILNKLGYKHRNYQENHRIQYMFGDIEIDIDSWPLIPTYLEIEANSEEEVLNFVNKLGMETKKVVTLDVEAIYREIYGVDIMKIEDLRF